MAFALRKLFRRQETLVSIDIGSSSIKVVELDVSVKPFRVVNLVVAPLHSDIFSNNIITKSEQVAEQLSSIIEANGLADKRAVTAVPGSSVFTKRIKINKVAANELADTIQMEAASAIPHNIDAVRLDYQILGNAGKNQLEVLIVAVKDEVINSFTDTLNLAGLSVAVVDVDHYAVQNIFEYCYPEKISSTVALVNIGARYSSINICRNGESLFTGELGIGGKLFTDALIAELGISIEQADALKKRRLTDDKDSSARDVIDRSVEYMASEINRQMSFLWSASGGDSGLEAIILSGGGCMVPGLVDELTAKTGVECKILDPLAILDCSEGFEKEFLAEVSPVVAVALGMAFRQPGDRIAPDLE